MRDLHFANPEWFYGLLVLIPMIAWYVWRQIRRTSSLQVSGLQPFEKVGTPVRAWLRHILFALRVLAIALLFIVMARPQSVNRWQKVNTEGIDIVIDLDISSSMLAQDFKPNRLEAAKNVAIQFISGRPDDRIGLVVFSGESFTQCPLTTDHAVLINLFQQVQSGMIEDGTAIGDGLATSINRLKDSEAKSKVVILLTDGMNNRGEIAPLTAAKIANTFGIRVYTIGVGTIGTAPYPVQTPYGGTRYQQMKVQIDENMLKQIASMTGGKYFRATDNKKLEEIYNAIDKLEKSKIDVKQFSRKEEEYLKFALWAAVLLLAEWFLRKTVFRTMP
ncbi:MAG TPA: VWA domain-containing protein [Bacteroidetes bacterium]|nr:VWA domain-containing protein [Bacteroidota bacterium]